MSDTDHTPGPWEAYVSDDRTLWCIRAGDDFVIYPGNEIDAETWDEAFGACGATTEGRSEANARLIAAAPDLLAALVRLLSATRERRLAMSPGTPSTLSERIAEAAIAKATRP
jgi:hypothetical protein